MNFFFDLIYPLSLINFVFDYVNLFFLKNRDLCSYYNEMKNIIL